MVIAGNIVRRLGILARTSSFLDLLLPCLESRPENAKLHIFKAFFAIVFTPTHPATTFMEQFILEHEPSYLFSRSVRFSSDKKAILRLLQVEESIPVRAFKNVNLHMVLQDKDLLREILKIHDISYKIKRVYSQGAYSDLDKTFLLGLMRFLLSPEFSTSFSATPEEVIHYRAPDGSVSLFNNQTQV